MIRCYDNYDLTGHNTFRMRVSCRRFVEYDSAMDLMSLDFSKLPQPVIHMGAGSNILFTGDFQGTVIHSCIKGISIDSETDGIVQVRVGAGEVLDEVCAWACSEDLWGLENLSLIPGETGAAAVQNVGAYGVEAGDLVKEVRLFDTTNGTTITFSHDDCRFAYRDSIFKKAETKGRYIVTEVTFMLSRKPRPVLSYGNLAALFGACGPQTSEQVRQAVIGVRRAKLPDPADKGSAGSFFKNPVVSRQAFDEVCRIAGPTVQVPHFEAGDGLVKIPAAWLIDQCGLKGMTRGGAMVYARQPLVIVNETGAATPEDVLALEGEVRGAVKDKYHITLQPEVEHI